MTLSRYLKMMITTTLFCWLCWVYILFTIDPEITNWIGFSLFYSSLFFSLIGTAAIIGFLIRFAVLHQELAFRAVKESFRQSFLFSFLITASLFLSSVNLFTWLNLGLLVVGLSALEFLLLSFTKS
jgi:hypothetical protein